MEWPNSMRTKVLNINDKMYLVEKDHRKTDQYELPVVKEKRHSRYDIYPVHNIGDGLIFRGYESLAKELARFSCITLDGYIGIRFEDVKQKLSQCFETLGVHPNWVNVGEALLPCKEVEALVAPYLGGDDPVFGKICPMELAHFFDVGKLAGLGSRNSEGLTIYYGVGASLVPVSAKNVFFDISKNEIQFRSRAGAITNLGARAATDAKEMYKRFYFVDWVVLNKHVNAIKQKIDFFVDGQRSTDITWMEGDVWRKSLTRISTHPIRARPWFEPGAWGGTWIKDNIDGVDKSVINYAWSFELIVPENGIILESSGIMLESTFDSLMFVGGKNILGTDFEKYKYLFPIRFDFLDTFNGGNLSVQCHPRVDYIKDNFGERITQEETYYILDRQHDAVVYLGFQEGVTPEAFRNALEQSRLSNKAIDVEQFIQSFEAKKHALFLIPPGTIHASGKDTMVLEISSTPYIYTFKMYDWLRVDLDGKERPLNIERGMENLVFERAGATVAAELISKPALLEKTDAYELYHLPTHREHLYDVHRFVINTEVLVATNNKAHVLSLVDGANVEVITGGKSVIYKYAETFVIPASAGQYAIRNPGDRPVMVVKAFIK